MKRLLHHPWLRRGAQWAIVLVALAYVFRSLIHNWQALRDYDGHFHALHLAGALLSFVLAQSLLAIASRQAFSGLGYPLGFRTVFRGYHISAVSTYLPGGLYLGRAIVFGEHGVDPISSSAEVMIELGMLTLSGILASIPYLFVVGTGVLAQMWMLGLMLIPPVFAVLYPSVINRVLRWLLARAGYRNTAVNLTSRQLLNMLLLDMAYWLLGGVGFYLLVSSVYAAPSKLFLTFVSAFSLADVAAIVLSVTPGAPGVYEGSLTLLLGPLLPTPLPALLALLARLSAIATLLILFGLATLLGKSLARTGARVRPPLREEERTRPG